MSCDQLLWLNAAMFHFFVILQTIDASLPTRYADSALLDYP